MGTSLPNLCPLQRPNSPTAALCLKVDWNRRRDGFLLFEDEVRAVNALLGKGRAISIPQPADSAYYRLIYTTLASLTWAMSLLDNNAGCSWPLRGEGRSEGGAQGHSKNITFILHRAALAAGLIPSPPSANLLLCKAESSHNQTTSALMEIFFCKQRDQNSVLITELGMCYDLPGSFDMRWIFITGCVCWGEIVFGRALDLDVILCSQKPMSFLKSSVYSVKQTIWLELIVSCCTLSWNRILNYFISCGWIFSYINWYVSPTFWK